MTLEEELIKIWTSGRELLRSVRAEGPVQYQPERVARSDYYTYTGLLKGIWGISFDKRCEQTGIIIKEHLFEAISSPNSYIRTWAKLIMEDTNEKVVV